VPTINKKIVLGIAGLVILVLAVIGISNMFNSPLTTSNVVKVTNARENRTLQEKNQSNFFSLQEVSKHNTKEDCWMIIDGKVYDVTSFIALGKHPPVIEMGCGKDATKLFKERTTENGTKIGSGKPHSENATRLLENYYVGNLIG